SGGHRRGQVSGNDGANIAGPDRDSQGLTRGAILPQTARILEERVTRMHTLQRTFSIIKPDAVAKGATGDILHMLQGKGFRIIGMRMLEITKQQAEGFYAVHASRPFFDSLTTFMSGGPIVVLALEKDNAIADLRKLMGATNPANAEE